MTLKKQQPWATKMSKRLFQLTKEARQIVRRPFAKDENPPKVLFILGCQRSGTTMMTRIFEQDWEVKVYPEHSVLSNLDALDGLRLNPLPQIREKLHQSRFPLVVLKPLVETQNALELLDFFPESRALWMYRHFADVANSNLNRFGKQNGIKNLRFIAQNDRSNWRSEKVSDALQALVKRYFCEEMNPYDAAALFWLVRNSYFFDLQLDHHPRVMMVRYSDLTADPAQMTEQIYAHAGQPFPGRQIVGAVHSQSVGKGRQINLSPAIESACRSLLEQLDLAYKNQAQQLLQLT